MIFVDSNVIIDLVEDGDWTAWAKRALATERRLVINVVVVAEVARAFRDADAVLVFLRELGIAVEPLTAETAYRAGHAHVAYRIAGGNQRTILADFLIGAHAESLGASLATRDRGRFSTYFPDLTLITPETQP